SVLKYLDTRPLPALNTLIVGGEKCPPELVARWGRDRHFIIAYGPTETTVCATVSVCDAVDEVPAIGRPITNVNAYVLGGDRCLLPPGIPGELYIGGEGLTRGYINQPDMTAERFIPNALAGGPGTILYRTGDLVRYRLDGNLEFVRRVDHQV